MAPALRTKLGCNKFSWDAAAHFSSELIGGLIMERKKKEVYHVGPLTEGKKNIISALMDEYEIKTAEDIQDALKDLLGAPSGL